MSHTPTQAELQGVHFANCCAVIYAADCTWLTTPYCEDLAEQMISVGYHIRHPSEILPAQPDAGTMTPAEHAARLAACEGFLRDLYLIKRGDGYSLQEKIEAGRKIRPAKAELLRLKLHKLDLLRGEES
jgi:hypothetical protein